MKGDTHDEVGEEAMDPVGSYLHLNTDISAVILATF